MKLLPNLWLETETRLLKGKCCSSLMTCSGSVVRTVSYPHMTVSVSQPNPDNSIHITSRSALMQLNSFLRVSMWMDCHECIKQLRMQAFPDFQFKSSWIEHRFWFKKWSVSTGSLRVDSFFGQSSHDRQVRQSVTFVPFGSKLPPQNGRKVGTHAFQFKRRTVQLNLLFLDSTFCEWDV